MEKNKKFGMLLSVLGVILSGFVLYIVLMKRKKGEIIDGRKGIILDLIKKRGSSSMPDIVKIIPGVTERTLRRDLAELEKEKLIYRTGNTKSTVYHIQ